MSAFRGWLNDRAPLIGAAIILAIAITILIVISTLHPR